MKDLFSECCLPTCLHYQTIRTTAVVLMDYKLGQKVVDKFTRLSKMDFSMECFTADFL